MTDDREPDWLDTIRNRVLQPRSGGPEPSFNGALRRAAILVLLVDSDDGPNLLLTERAATLANYPGILVSPAARPKQLTTGPLPLPFEKQPKRPASTQPTFTSSGHWLPCICLRPASW